MLFRGVMPGEDAPDIVANTFLAQMSEKTLQDIGYGFLDHRECETSFYPLEKENLIDWSSANFSQ